MSVAGGLAYCGILRLLHEMRGASVHVVVGIEPALAVPIGLFNPFSRLICEAVSPLGKE